MAERSFGPTRAAGTRIVEKNGAKNVQAAATGVAAYTGILEKGPTNELITLSSPKDAARKIGGRIADSLLPDAIQDFFDRALGAGRLYVLRVTDGTEEQATVDLLDQHSGTYAPRVTGSDQNVRQAVLRVKARSAGRWGGRFQFVNDLMPTSVAASLTNTTLTTGVTMLKDELKGATLILAGVTGKTYTVLSNTTAGVLTVTADARMKDDIDASSDTTNREYTVVLEPEVNAAGSRRAVTAKVVDGLADQTGLFGLDVYIDGEFVKRYDNLSLDSTSRYYVENVINNDTANEEIRVTNLYTGTFATLNRPANWAGELTAVSATSATLPFARILEAKRSNGTANTGNGVVWKFTALSGAKLVKDRLTLVKLAGGGWSISSEKFGNLTDAGAEGAAGTAGSVVTARNIYTIGFTIRAGSTAFVTDDRFVIDVDPLPVKLTDGASLLVGSYIMPNPANRRSKFRVKSATHTTITTESGDMTAAGTVATAATPATVTGTVTGTFAITLSTNDKVKLKVDGLGSVTATLTAGATRTAAQVAADINTAFTDTAGQTAGYGVAPYAVIATVVSDKIVLTAPNEYPYCGANSRITIEAVANDAYTTLGFTAGTVTGTAGTVCRVEGPTELVNGTDGIAGVVDANYTTAHLNSSTSKFLELLEKNVGLVKCAAPGVTSTAVQRAGQTFASDLNWQWRLEIPDNITTDEAAEAHVNSTLGRNDFSVVAFPSFGYVLDPDKPGLQKLVPLTGMIHGVEARFAADYEGYHKAVAGLAAVLPRVVRLPTGDRVLNEELLNPNGLQAIKKKAGNFVIWGDRTVSVDPAWIWKHQREQMSHYEHTLAENFDWAIFEINDPRADFLIRSALLAFFAPEYRKGAIRGTDLEDAALIKVDSEINTDSTRATGDLFAEVSLRLANTVERLTIRMSKQGVTELAKAA